MAREMLQELQAGAGAAGVRYNPLRPGLARPGTPRGKPYTGRCTYKQKCKPPGTPVPLKPGAARPGAPRGKPYTRPCRYGKNCKRPPGPGS
ncbi:hypothetical protein ACLOJK_033005 [Asimina triloba]